MKSLFISKRILLEIKNDKRTIALILFAPLIVLSLVYSILVVEKPEIKLGVINAPNSVIENLKKDKDIEINIVKVDFESSKEKLEDKNIDISVDLNNKYEGEIFINAYNSNSQIIVPKIKKIIFEEKNKELEKQIEENVLLKEIFEKINIKEISEDNIQNVYVAGEENTNLFDKIGVGLIGIIVFFFVYLVGGINFLRERVSGTLEKLLATPVKRYEIIFGYNLGFSILAFIQTIFVTLFAIYVLGITNQGNIFYVLIINLLTAITALSLGLLVSNLARNEFQFIQFIPLIISVQIFLCGIFDLSAFWNKVSYIIPLKYTVESLQKIMLYGNSFQTVIINIMVLLGFIVLFIVSNIIVLKKYRKL